MNKLKLIVFVVFIVTLGSCNKEYIEKDLLGEKLHGTIKFDSFFTNREGVFTFDSGDKGGFKNDNDETDLNFGFIWYSYKDKHITMIIPTGNLYEDNLEGYLGDNLKLKLDVVENTDSNIKLACDFYYRYRIKNPNTYTTSEVTENRIEINILK